MLNRGFESTGENANTFLSYFLQLVKCTDSAAVCFCLILLTCEKLNISERNTLEKMQNLRFKKDNFSR